jgi:hypothetical protein
VHLAFNFKWEGENIVAKTPEPINQENLSLLLAWPGILVMQLVGVTGDKFYENTLDKLTNYIEQDVDYSKIKKFIDYIFDPAIIPDRINDEIRKASVKKDTAKISKLKRELYHYVPDIYPKAILLLHPRNLSLVAGRELITLIYSLADFFISWCMIVRCFDRNDGDTYITKSAIYENYSKCQNKNHLNIYSLSNIFPTILDYFIQIDTNRLFENINADNELDCFIVSNIKTPSIKFSLNRVFPDNHLAYIKSYKSTVATIFKDSEILGTGYNIRKLLGFPNELWRTRSFNNPASGGFLLFNESYNEKDLLATLVEDLFRSAMKATKASHSLLTSWQGFIDNPYDNIDEHFEKYYPWISSIISHDYLIRDEFFKFQSLSRIVGDLDTVLDYEDVNDARKLYKKAKKFHIPFEHRKKLLEADIELSEFVNTVIKNDLCIQEKAMKFFRENKSKYKYICLLDENDIKKIWFSTEANSPRHNRQHILPIINKKLGGKEFTKSALTKLLGLQASDQKYSNFAG